MHRNTLTVCATCLAFRDHRDSDLPLTEDIKGVLRGLLYDFDIDAFFRLKPQDKDLKLCKICNNTLRDMIAFKQCVLKSFKELMKCWCDDEQGTVTNIVTAPSSSQTANVQSIEIEIPIIPKKEEPNPLETKDIKNIIDIKEETNINDINEPGPVTRSKRKQLQPTENNNGGKPRINKLKTTNSTKGSANSKFLNRIIIIPSDKKLNELVTNRKINKVTATNSSKGSSNSKFSNRVIVIPKNKKLNELIIDRKIVKIDTKGNIDYTGVKLTKPISKTEEDKSTTVQQSSVAISTCEIPANGVPNPNKGFTQIVEECGQVCDISETETEMAYNQANPSKSISEHAQKKWYIKIVTREEILTNMEEKRNHPDFLKAPYKCVSCVSLFYTEQLAETHRDTFHAEDSQFTCFACHSTFKSFKALNAHYYVHMVDLCTYYCTTCDFETKHIQHIREHVCPNAGCKTLPPKDPDTMRLSKCKTCYYCPKCQYVTTYSSLLLVHYKNQHMKNPKVQCGECGKFYKTVAILKQHIDVVHRGQRPPVRPGYCTLCHKWYADIRSYNVHMNYMHTPRERKIECDECGKKFLSERGLEYHKEFHAAVKAGVKNYECNVCGKEYYTLKILRRHMLDKHEKPPPTRDHVCELCGMAFFTGLMLRRHSAKHSDERPYQCSICGDTFKYSGVLKTHTKLKHMEKKSSEEVQKKEKSKESKRQEKRGIQKKKKSVKRKRTDGSSTGPLVWFADEK